MQCSSCLIFGAVLGWGLGGGGDKGLAWGTINKLDLQPQMESSTNFADVKALRGSVIWMCEALQEPDFMGVSGLAGVFQDQQSTHSRATQMGPKPRGVKMQRGPMRPRFMIILQAMHV